MNEKQSLPPEERQPMRKTGVCAAPCGAMSAGHHKVLLGLREEQLATCRGAVAPRRRALGWFLNEEEKIGKKSTFRQRNGIYRSDEV